MAGRTSSIVGNGRKVFFWWGKWCGLVPLSVAFPSLYAIATSKNALVTIVWSLDLGGVGILCLQDLVMIEKWRS